MHAAVKKNLRDGAKSAALAVAVAVATLFGTNFIGPIQQASQWLEDFRFAYAMPLDYQNPDLVVLEINEDSLRPLPYRSPIDRLFLADIIGQLLESHSPKAIGIDLIFDQPTIPENDAALRAVLVDERVPIVAAHGEAGAGMDVEQFAFQSAFLDGVTTGSSALRAQSGTVRTYFPQSPTTGEASLASALAAAAGIEPPQTPFPILYRRGAIDNARPIRAFPAHNVALLPSSWLENQIVLIGAVLSDRDRHMTPLSNLGGVHELTPGVIIHAQALAQMLTDSSLPALSVGYATALTLFSVLFGLFLALAPLPSPLRVAVGAITILTYWLAAFSPQVYTTVPLPLLGPTLAFFLAIASATALARQRERRQRLFLHNAFNHYVSAEIIDDLLANPERLSLGGQQRDMAFIFTDIAGFSSLAENVSPSELIDILSDYLDGLVDIALRHRGTIARFVGDGLVIFFGAPVADANHKRHAVRCAIDMDEFCERYRHEHPAAANRLGITRIGVHAGPAVVGNVGGAQRFEYTAHGDVVNTAARLEGANKHLRTRICISSDAAAGDVEERGLRPLGSVVVKGRQQPLDLVTVWEELDAESRNDYLKAFALTEAHDPLAPTAWSTLAERYPNDGPIALYMDRLRRAEHGVRFVLTEK